VIASCSIVLLVCAFLASQYKPLTSARVQYFIRTFRPHKKVKIVVGFYMISTKVGDVYRVSLPASVRTFLDSMSMAVSLGLQGFAVTPLECMGLSGYIPRLIFWMLIPPVAVALVTFGIAVISALRARRRPRRSEVLEKSASWLLGVLFLLYPVVTNVAFECFPCHEFANGRGWMVADVAIECRTPAHDVALFLGYAAIFLYGVGLWFTVLY
jgi:hypothetical protein